jgi:hypothetical protein
MEIELHASKKVQAQEEISFTIYAKDLIDRPSVATTIILSLFTSKYKPFR